MALDTETAPSSGRPNLTFGHPATGENLLGTGICADPKWTWVVRRDGDVVGYLLASGAHRAIHLEALAITPEVGNIWQRALWLRGLCRYAAEEARQDPNYNGAYAFIEDGERGEKLSRIMRQILGTIVAEGKFNGQFVAGAWRRHE